MNNKQFWVTAILSSLTMATIMSGLISQQRNGFPGAEWPPIIQSFFLAWPCAIVLNLTVLLAIRKLSAWLSLERFAYLGSTGTMIRVCMFKELFLWINA